MKISIICFLLFLVPAVFHGKDNVTCLTEGEDATWSQDGLLIVYRNANEVGTIDKGKITKFASRPGRKGNLILSPDGETMLSEEEDGLWSVNIKNGQSRFITMGNSPCYSPKGDAIACENEGSIWVMTEGMERKECVISRGKEDNFSPVWFCNGKKLLFIREGNLFLLNLDTKEASLFVKGGQPHRYFRRIIPSPDEKRLLVILSSDWRAEGGSDTALIIDAATLKEEMLGETDDPSWSSDGRKIVYSCKGEIWLAKIEGGKKKLTSGYIDGNPRLSPDGEKVLFCSWRMDTNKDGVIDWQDRKQICLLSDIRYDYRPGHDY